MQAVILAGGLGTRMRPLTEKIPKPMLPVNGRPFLYHQIELLKSQGFSRFLLLVAYRGDEIRKFFLDGKSLGVHIEYSDEASPLGTGGALKNAEARLDAEFLLLNGDTFLDIHYQDLAVAYKACGSPAMVVAYENGQKRLPNNLAVASGGEVTAYSKKDAAGVTHVDAGVIALDKRILELIPAGRSCSLEEEIYPVLVRRRELRAWPTSEAFIDIGSPAGLEALGRKLP
jgi:NDP-sugar pyrophosphorylase family protein